MELVKANKIAIDICYKLQPFCDIVKIAGSIRRKKAEVKDIEICAIIKRMAINDLFGTPIDWIPEKGAVDVIYGLGEVIKGNPDGRYMQIKLHEGINLDLFMPEKKDFYRQFAIRTGSAEYSHKVIASAWKKHGWCGTPNGLRKVSECTQKVSSDGKSTAWTCHSQNPQLPPVWTCEEHFFEWLGVKFINPENRN